MQTPAAITCYQLTCLAATISGVSHSRVFSPERTKRVCRVRYAVWHVLYSTGDYTLQDIADASGYLDHSTIINGLRRARKLIKTSPAFRDLLAILSKPRPHDHA